MLATRQIDDVSKRMNKLQHIVDHCIAINQRDPATKLSMEEKTDTDWSIYHLEYAIRAINMTPEETCKFSRTWYMYHDYLRNPAIVKLGRPRDFLKHTLEKMSSIRKVYPLCRVIYNTICNFEKVIETVFNEKEKEYAEKSDFVNLCAHVKSRVVEMYPEVKQ